MNLNKPAVIKKLQERFRNVNAGRGLYTAFLVPTMLTMFSTRAFAADTIWTKASAIMQDVYTQILGISTIAAVVTAAIALLLMNFSRSGRTVDESRAWLKRIIITWAILNSLGFSHEHANQYTGELLPPSPASAPYAIFRQSSETVRTSVIIGLGSKLAVLQAQQVRNITSYNEIDLELPGKQKCAYFCIVSDQDSTYDFLSSLFFSFLFIRLIRYADAYCEGGMLHPKVKFILDEFPNCCLIPDFTKKCSTIRSRGCSVAVFFQNVGQMRNRYPDDQWQEILGACDSTVFLGCTDMLTAEYFSDRIGTASVEVEGTMRELNTMHITDYTPRFRKTNSLGRRPLLTPDEVLRLPPNQVLIFIRGQKVMRAKRFDYSLHPDYKKLKSRKAILHEPDWKSSQASSVSASGVSSPSVTAAIPAEKANVGSQKKPPGKPPRSTTRKVVNADELF